MRRRVIAVPVEDRMRQPHSTRQTRLAVWFGSVLQDLRYAWRSLAGHASFTAMALTALVLGIGLNTSVFTVINSLLTRPWDVPEPGRVVSVHDLQSFGLAATAARYLDENSRAVEGVLARRVRHGQFLRGASCRHGTRPRLSP